jgi:adhesin transport system membrane fusion protein
MNDSDHQAVAPVRMSGRLATFIRGLRLEQLNPFARSAEAADPFATYRIEDQMLARDFALDADAAAIGEDPLRARKAIKAVGIGVIVFLLWATFGEVDELTKGDGKVIPSRQLQVVQSLDGGIVSGIEVKEGDTVKEGQVLIKIDAIRFVSTFNESRATYLALLAKAARLQAVASGSAFVPPPEVQKENPALVDQERTVYLNRKAELDGQIGIAREQLTQRTHELGEAQARREQAQRGYELTARELEMTKPLIKSGAVSDVELLRLERDVARYSGEADQAKSQITRLQAAINEAQRKVHEVELEFKNQARNELADTQAKINSLAAGSEALSDKVKQADIKSPVNGTVKRILYNTVGGVVQPGKDVVEIVPLEDALLLEARVSPRDIAFLHPGQHANVKLTAYDFTIYGGLAGTLEHIGADSVVDEKGNAFYIVRVRTERPNFGANLPIIPGMVAEVDILTGKKSILSYLLKPVLRAKQYAMTER